MVDSDTQSLLLKKRRKHEDQDEEDNLLDSLKGTLMQICQHLPFHMKIIR